MYNKVLLVLLLACVALSNCNDISIGSEGKLIYNETIQASPALWRQDNNITIATNKIISKIVVTDLREHKDGNIEIVEGGQGQTNVTFELKSPSILRGYEFHIEVYAVPSEEYKNEGSTAATSDVPSMDSTTGLPTKVNLPAILGKGDNIRSGRAMKDDEHSLNTPKTGEEQTTEDASTTTYMPDTEAQDKTIQKEKQDAENHEIVDLILDMNDQSEKSALRSEKSTMEDVTSTTDNIMESTTYLNDEITASTPNDENEFVEKAVKGLSVPVLVSTMEPPKESFSNEWNTQDSRFEGPRMHQLRNEKFIK